MKRQVCINPSSACVNNGKGRAQVPPLRGIENLMAVPTTIGMGAHSKGKGPFHLERAFDEKSFRKGLGKPFSKGFPKKNPGAVLLSHGVAPAVPSPLEGLTSVFGMGTGVSPPPWAPE